MASLAIIDYGMGNLNSVAKAIAHVAPQLSITLATRAADVAKADRVVLPGQAAMPDTIRAMHETGMYEATLAAHKSGKPFFGMCLGLQMLFDHSNEGDTTCLKLYRGKVVRFPQSHKDAQGNVLKVPHMGWNAVRHIQPHPLWDGIEDGSAFYFANSFYCTPENQAGVAGLAHYPDPFCVAYGQDNVFAVQFHPEKSSHAGLRLLHNFTHWNP